MLGFVYVKLAADPPPPQGYAQAQEPEPSAQDRVFGVNPSTYQAGGIPRNQGTGTAAQGITAFVSDTFGPEWGATLGPLMQVIMPHMSPATRDWMLKQRRFAAGPGTVGEANQISTALSQANKRMMAANGRAMSGRMAEFVNTLPNDGVGGYLKQFGGMLTSLAASNPDIAGQLVTMVRQMDTPITPLLNQFLGDIPTSYMPLVQAVYTENNGVLDPAVLEARVNEFDQALASGAFVSREVDQKTGKPYPMTADVAMGSFGLAAQSLGTAATLTDRVELARLAQSVLNHGLAKNSEVAYTMLRVMGPQQALQNPLEFDRKMEHMAQRLKAVGGDVPGVVMGSLEIAGKNGIPFEHALEYAARDAERRQVWDRGGKTPAQQASFQGLSQAAHVTRTKGFAEAESVKGLAAWVTQTPQGQAAYHDFLAKPTPEKSASMFAAARNAKTWASRGDFDTSVLRSDMSPAHMEALQLGEQQTFAQEVSGRNGTLARIMRDPSAYRDMIEDPTRMSAAQQKLYSSLSVHDRKFLNNAGRRGILTEHMAATDAANAPKAAPSQIMPYQRTTEQDLVPKPPVKVEPAPIKPPEVPGAGPSSP